MDITSWLSGKLRRGTSIRLVCLCSRAAARSGPGAGGKGKKATEKPNGSGGAHRGLADRFSSLHDQHHHLFVALVGAHVVLAADIVAFVRKPGDLTTIYVSKVDTTGCHAPGRLSIGLVVRAILRYVVAKYRRRGPVRLQLYAKSQAQYIFPCSSSNRGKNVLSDAGLLRWWLMQCTRVCEALSDSAGDLGARGFLSIPGAEKIQTQRYLAPVAPDSGDKPPACRWAVGNAYDADARIADVLLRFDDDPKTRFLDDLDRDRELANVTVAAFWERLAYRQELSLGHATGFIMVDVPPDQAAVDAGSSEATTDVKLVETEVGGKVFRQLRELLEAESYGSADETAASTKKWCAAVDKLCGEDKVRWLEIVGSAETDAAEGVPTSQQSRPSSATVVAANVLTVRQKKRKPDDGDVATSQTVTANILVPRKKVPKPTAPTT